ncbi:MAG: helix-turn-helix domain-containing protein [Selenomonadaceae bacterium]|nr:helix-turn-helix domain-containing protein [Selenomonadaceae bacterium]
MEYIKGYKFRLYPNKRQAILLNKTFGCCRFVFNHFLSIRRDSWENEKKSVSYNETSALMTQLKSDENYLWLKEADSVATIPSRFGRCLSKFFQA